MRAGLPQGNPAPFQRSRDNVRANQTEKVGLAKTIETGINCQLQQEDENF
jgi:hypothetical protein